MEYGMEYGMDVPGVVNPGNPYEMPDGVGTTEKIDEPIRQSKELQKNKAIEAERKKNEVPQPHRPIVPSAVALAMYVGRTKDDVSIATQNDNQILGLYAQYVRNLLLGPKGGAPLTAEEMETIYDYVKNHPEAAARIQDIAEKTTKRWVGWKIGDNGEYIQDETADTAEQQLMRLKAIQDGDPKKQVPWYKRWFVSDKVLNAAIDPARAGIAKGFEDAMSWDRLLKDPRGHFRMWARYKGYNKLADFANNKELFWGSLAAGGVVLTGAVVSWLSGRGGAGNRQQYHTPGSNTGGTVTNNYYYGNNHAGGGGSVPPASTSFWRLNTNA